jgi:hypothetical protein
MIVSYLADPADRAAPRRIPAALRTRSRPIEAERARPRAPATPFAPRLDA